MFFNLYYNFFFSSRRRHTRWPRDWSSDVCSSDLLFHINHEMKQPLTNEINTIIHSYDKVLVTAGRFVKEKDQHTLLRAFAKEIGRASCRERMYIKMKRERLKKIRIDE